MNQKRNRITRGVVSIITICLMMLGLASMAVAGGGKEKAGEKQAVGEAGEYPTKPIEHIVPFGAGGSTDLSARTLASVVPQYLGQPLVIVNKGGGGGAIGIEYVRKAKPDGYTMMQATIGPLAIYPAMHRKSPHSYDTLAAVARTEIIPAVLVARPDERWDSLTKFVNYAKNNPGELKYAIAGVASLSDLGAKSFLIDAGIPLNSVTGVPFDGTAESVAALLGAHADFSYLNLSPCLEHIKAGNLVALGISTPDRIDQLPEVPTFTEKGYKESDVMGWKGVVGPPGLPVEIIRVWEDAIKKTVEDDAWLTFQKKLGTIPGYLGHEDFAEYIEKQYKKFRQIAEEEDLLMD